MCAIIGFIGRAHHRNWPLVKAILAELLVASEIRGRDATGFFAVSSHRSRRTVLAKRPLPARDFVRTTPAWRLLNPSCVVLAHTRLATHGDPRDNRNNHPFVSDDGGFALVHNGVISNHRDVARDQGLTLTSACDSEAILRLVEVVGCGATGLEWVLRECRGSIAAAVYDQRQQTVWLASNGGRPLVVCKLRGITGVFMASTPGLIMTALESVANALAADVEMLLPLAADTITGVRPDGSIRCVDAPTTADAFRFP